MPLPSRWMIRCSFIYLVVGFLIGAGLLINKAYPVYPRIWILLPIHIEMLIFGWIIQFTLGTAYWILPKRQKHSNKRAQLPAMIIPIALNLGILLNISDHLFRLFDHAWLFGRSLELIAVLFFITLHWQRVTSFRNKGTNQQ
jgi:hypothetical protein